MDCKITKDCKEINRIASTSLKIHNPTTVRGACEAIQEPQQSVSIRTQFGRIARKSTINAIPYRSTGFLANSDCNRHQIGLQKDCETGTDCQVIKGLHQNPRMSTICKRSSPILAQSFAIPCNPEDCGRIAYSTQSHRNPVSTRLLVAIECHQTTHHTPYFEIHPVLSFPDTTRLDCNWITKMEMIAM